YAHIVQTLDAALDLTPQQEAFLLEPDNEPFLQDLHNFWYFCEKSNADENFAKAAIQAKMNSGQVFFVDMLIYDPSLDEMIKSRMSPAEVSLFNDLSQLRKKAYLMAAVQSYIYAETHFPKPVRNRKGDAFKHAFWNALSTVYKGEGLTSQLTTAHENIEYDPDYPNHYKETQMDLHNNAKGRQIAYGAGKLYQLVHEAMNNGDLRYLNNLVYQDGFWNATNSSQLIPTNQ
ncbi:MAG: DUF6973 domain-containing protein, partial [Winogradskyella sp.]